VVGHASGEGLTNLVDRNADVAMISAPIDVAVAAAEIAGTKVDPASCRCTSCAVVFAVNAANPVRSLALAQVGDIHAGRITKSKQVGGKDLPITVYTTAANSGTSLLVRRWP
jgi:phosphate transport system substrate-binding protein